MTETLGIEEALDMAIGAELQAQAFYAQAASEVQDPGGRDLLGRLAAFEQHHYQKLSELAHSLAGEGKFIAYQPRTLQDFSATMAALGQALPAGGEALVSLIEQFTDVPGILTRAIGNEQTAGERYRALADRTADVEGQAMFRALAGEEELHRRVLEDEFFSLSNRGVWGWSGMYGE